MLYVPFLPYVFSFVCFGRQWLPFSSPLCVFLLHLQNGRDCQGLTVGVYLCAAHVVCIPILPHRCWLLRERASIVGPSHSCFMKKHHSNFLWIRVQFSEANGRNKSSGLPVTMQHLLCLYHDVNGMVQNASVFFFIFYKDILMTAVLIGLTCNWQGKTLCTMQWSKSQPIKLYYSHYVHFNQERGCSLKL